MCKTIYSTRGERKKKNTQKMRRKITLSFIIWSFRLSFDIIILTSMLGNQAGFCSIYTVALTIAVNVHIYMWYKLFYCASNHIKIHMHKNLWQLNMTPYINCRRHAMVLKIWLIRSVFIECTTWTADTWHTSLSSSYFNAVFCDACWGCMMFTATFCKD